MSGCPQQRHVGGVRRLESVCAVLDGGGEDPLENEEQMTDQMDALPFLCRFQYERTCSYLTSLMDPLMSAYSAAASSPGTPCPLPYLWKGMPSWGVRGAP